MQLRRKSVADSACWPPACKVAIQPGETEQQRFFDVLSPPPSAWIEQIRAAIPEIADRLAWAWTATLESEFRALESRWNSRKSLARQLVSTLFQKS
jgi:hypothetical protein